MSPYDPEMEATMKRLYESLNERDRRRYAGVETLKLGPGGRKYIAGVLASELGSTLQSLKFSGNLQGTFYLADIRLKAQAPPPPITAVLESRQSTAPTAFTLDQNYPNPFNSDTVIRFALSRSREVELTVFNLAGQQETTLVDGLRPGGAYTVTWDGRDDQGCELASGVYLYRLQTGRQVETRKLLLLR